MTTYKGFPIRYDLNVYRGDTFERMFKVIVKDPATGVAFLLDTTDFAASLYVREAVDAEGVKTAAIMYTGIRGTAPNQYNLAVRVPSSVTADYPHGAVWRYDLEITDPSGRKQTLLYGEFRVQGDIAR